MVLDPERCYQRAPCSFPGTFACEGSSNPVEVVSLSIGGCYFACKIPVSVGSGVFFAIRLSDQYLIRGRGRVIWNSDTDMKMPSENYREGLPPGFGIKFEGLRREDYQMIDSFVRRKLRILRGIAYELRQKPCNKVKVKSLFSEVHPDESDHLNHIRKVVREELRFFRIRR